MIARRALAILLALGVTTGVLCADDAPGPKLEDVPKLTVRGEAELERAADQVHINIGVVTQADGAGDALRENSEKMRLVIDALTKAGIVEDEYETGRFRVRPLYSRRPRQPAEDWQPQIIGYEVVNSIAITTMRLDLAGDLIGAANDAGANTIDIAGFDLSDPRVHRAEAIREATSHALEDAAILAEAAHLKLVRIVSINLDHASARAAMESAMAGRARLMADGNASPPVAPGKVTVRASVTVVYEIAPDDS